MALSLPADPSMFSPTRKTKLSKHRGNQIIMSKNKRPFVMMTGGRGGGKSAAAYQQIKDYMEESGLQVEEVKAAKMEPSDHSHGLTVGGVFIDEEI